jgi:hypothetical protein
MGVVMTREEQLDEMDNFFLQCETEELVNFYAINYLYNEEYSRQDIVLCMKKRIAQLEEE